ncbi:MAG: flagellar hook-associated protein FlgL [Roseburia sp.]
MRITNNMIMNNTKTNINGNKTNLDTLNNQMSSQKKISKPSDDPVIAIRALRLRSSLSQINQYYEKNIPDAESWLEVTETALDNMKSLLTDIHTQCVRGSTGTLNADDRNTILKQLKALGEQVYSEGDADYAGRTVFTGYKTNNTLTFQADSTDTYNIKEYLSYEDIEEFQYSYGTVETPTATDVAKQTAVNSPGKVTLSRLRLAYDSVTGLTSSGLNYSYIANDGSTVTGTLTVSEKTTEELENAHYAVAADQVVFNKDTGEFLLGQDVASDLNSKHATLSVSYDKTGFSKGEIKPENYYDCTNITDAANPISYTNYDLEGNRINQDIEYTIAANQTLVVNTQANDVFDSDIKRDVDDLVNVVQDAINAHDTVDTIKSMMTEQQYSDETSQKYLQSCLDAANKQADYADARLEKLFSRGLTKFENYMSSVNIAITDVGSKGQRLDITKTRMSNQQMTVEALKSDNEDAELSDIVIDYTAAYTAYQASLQAAAKIEKQTLLDYI